MTTPIIDSIYDISDKAKVELKQWLEPWLLEWVGGEGIRYKTLNVGDWLSIEVTGAITAGLGAGWGLFLEPGPAGTWWRNEYDVQVDMIGDAEWRINGSGGSQISALAGGGVEIASGAAAVTVSIETAGQTFDVLDASNNPIFTLTG